MHPVVPGAGIRNRHQSAWRRATRLTILFSVLGVAAVLGMFVRLPILVLEPGPAPDVAERTQIDAPTFRSVGSIHLTTAQVAAPLGATTAEVMKAIFNEDKVLIARAAIYPPGQSARHTETIQAAQMTRSELEAAVAALAELGLPLEPAGVFVEKMLESAPAARNLLAGDVITGVNSRQVSMVAELTDVLNGRLSGSEVRLEVIRGDEELSFVVELDEPQSNGPSSALGAEVTQFNRPPVKVSISSRDIGGPSAGLMYALSIYDRLIPDDITGGRTIAGTGTITNSEEGTGVVGAVGSVALKVKGAARIGADVFMVPKAEVAEARAAAGPGMEVIGVSTLNEAITELKRTASPGTTRSQP